MSLVEPSTLPENSAILEQSPSTVALRCLATPPDSTGHGAERGANKVRIRRKNDTATREQTIAAMSSAQLGNTLDSASASAAV
jgi:hypothetical protein